jgi:hypothetical protein
VNGFQWGMLGVGGLFVYGGLTGRSPLQSALMVLQGYPASATPVAAPVAGSAAAGNAPVGGGGTLRTKPATPHNNRLLGKEIASEYGWGTGPQWAALDWLFRTESSWRNTATNPTSGAYGIAQALPPSKMPPAALPPTSDPGLQISWGLSYIKDRYGTPVKAKQFHLANGWY